MLTWAVPPTLTLGYGVKWGACQRWQEDICAAAKHCMLRSPTVWAELHTCLLTFPCLHIAWPAVMRERVLSSGRQKWLSKTEERRADRKAEVWVWFRACSTHLKAPSHFKEAFIQVLHTSTSKTLAQETHVPDSMHRNEIKKPPKRNVFLLDSSPSFWLCIVKSLNNCFFTQQGEGFATKPPPLLV